MMNRADVIKKVAEVTGFTQKDTKVVMDALQEVVFTSLSNEEEVKIMDGVTLCAVHKEARTGRNPRTGETVKIAARTAVTFKAGSKLKDAVNK